MSLPFDHVAVPSGDVSTSVRWYVQTLGAKVLYEDRTWAFLEIGGAKLAIVTPTQHPPHVAVRVTPQQLDAAAQQHGKSIDTHRDGTRGIYIADPFGNAVELICYPTGQTVYERP